MPRGTLRELSARSVSEVSDLLTSASTLGFGTTVTCRLVAALDQPENPSLEWTVFVHDSIAGSPVGRPQRAVTAR